MKKGVLTLLLMTLMVLPEALLSQSSQTYNSNYQPLPLVKRLSYENFRNIKLLHAAVINFGEGQSQIEKLVDQYSEASALYFQNKIEEAAAKFSENEREILKTAQNLARKYRQDAETLFQKGIKMNVKNELKRSLQGDEENPYTNKYLDNAKFAVHKANDYYDRYINARTASPRPLITAIYYYRQAKKNVFNMIKNMEFSDDESKNKEIIESHLQGFEKDMVDNNNRVFKSREKEN
jgi:predicted transposase